MATSNLDVRPARVAAPSRHLAAFIPLGVASGLIAYYAIAAAATIPAEGFSFSPAALLLVGLVAAAATLVADRWPILGLSAGLVVLVIVAYAVLQGVSWTTTETGSLDPRVLVGFGAASGYPTMVGAVMLAASVRSLTRRPASS